jgi:type III pantothenate kinase
MLLAIDVGNTLTKFGLFDGDALKRTFQRETNPKETYDEYKARLDLFLESQRFSLSSVDGVIISCVVPSLKPLLVKLIADTTGLKALTVGPRLKTGMVLKVDNPMEVGSDLVADAVGGLLRHGKALFIADLGTANKFIFIDNTGAFSGLAIGPGLSISMEALVGKTAALPEVSMTIPSKVMGKNTADCMNSGITYGTAFQILGFADAFEKEAGYPLKRIVTGGNASFVKDLLMPNFEVDDDLLLHGLSAIYERNRKE